jgi:hypothetical protein
MSTRPIGRWVRIAWLIVPILAGLGLALWFAPPGAAQ